ncbi:hypothetical protein Tco_0410876 [Tanacetum coccineum]
MLWGIFNCGIEVVENNIVVRLIKLAELMCEHEAVNVVSVPKSLTSLQQSQFTPFTGREFKNLVLHSVLVGLMSSLHTAAFSSPKDPLPHDVDYQGIDFSGRHEECVYSFVLSQLLEWLQLELFNIFL